MMIRLRLAMIGYVYGGMTIWDLHIADTSLQLLDLIPVAQKYSTAKLVFNAQFL